MGIKPLLQFLYLNWSDQNKAPLLKLIDVKAVVTVSMRVVSSLSAQLACTFLS
jgi:hypothetical protein